jgi:hypothetical protein
VWCSGTFIEYRTGMMNISPIGRNCDREERDAFEVYDLVRPPRHRTLGLYCNMELLSLPLHGGDGLKDQILFQEPLTSASDNRL